MNKIIQIVTGWYDNNIIFALCEDGKLYSKNINSASPFTEFEI